jgi:hypothetical protein
MMSVTQLVTFLSTFSVLDYCWPIFVALIVIALFFPFGLILYDIINLNLHYAHESLMSIIQGGERSDNLRDEKTKYTTFCYSHNGINEIVAKSIQDAVGDYLPPWWYSAHLGTMISFGHDLELAYETEMIKSQDGGHFQISWYPSKPSQNSGQLERKIIVFFPGLSLTAKSVSPANIIDL